MSVPRMLAHLFLERLSRQELPRVPEADAVMEVPEQIAAFADSGAENGILAWLYLFHSLQSAPLIRPGDTVLDLACGPANQLLRIAQLNPQAQFIGVDASARMLEQARATLERNQVGNVSLLQDDITCLRTVKDSSVDCALCTMSLHHLPDVHALQQTMHTTRRVLRRRGGVYLADFGRLKHRATQNYFAYDRADCQSAQFTRDFLNSLQAAFSVEELAQATAVFDDEVRQSQTALAPFMVVLKTPPRRQIDDATRGLAHALHAQLSAGQRRDFNNFDRWFRAAGNPSALALK
ncbi:class I SAM-dependent methyltransferase [Rhodocyclus tenuis]|uniref:Ubiquinone/menaquinone biosynthesis C-methylase UbiE n=1 Tax=Rhodocyclus tenuis TaxID=1066 RepID=A0A840G4Y5_RHOTE|nr:class I SAM-dependent methyltransferase [Rhodocyclus tenuis]MBB4245808.1 ubiquinone/menaquinone biosynthesis C-methylase UbiE [Rhodocyclus tenuis]